jgi:hypothetical protein
VGFVDASEAVMMDQHCNAGGGTPYMTEEAVAAPDVEVVAVMPFVPRETQVGVAALRCRVRRHTGFQRCSAYP